MKEARRFVQDSTVVVEQRGGKMGSYLQVAGWSPFTLQAFSLAAVHRQLKESPVERVPGAKRGPIKKLPLP